MSRPRVRISLNRLQGDLAFVMREDVDAEDLKPGLPVTVYSTASRIEGNGVIAEIDEDFVVVQVDLAGLRAMERPRLIDKNTVTFGFSPNQSDGLRYDLRAAGGSVRSLVTSESEPASSGKPIAARLGTTIT